MQALHEAGTAIAPAKRGVLVVGESNAGKTRLALETLREALPSWPVLVWRPDYTKEDIPPIEFLNGKQLVLFLDDLQEYAAGQMRDLSGQLSIADPHAMTLRTLIETLLQAAQRIIIIATCRAENQAQTQIALGWLFVELTTAEISSFSANAQDPKARQTIAEFAKRGTIHIKDWDGTLGSLVLGLSTKNSQYLALPSHAKSVLQAMKLLSLARTTVHTEQRIRAVCAGVFAEKRVQEDEQAWQEAVNLLIQIQFVKEVNESSLEMILAIRKDAYFEQVVTDYPQPQRPYQLIRDLIQLSKVLKALDDAQALLDLGYSLSVLGRHEEALAAFEQALTLDPTNADTWYYKGIALGLLERYEEALAAFEQALTLDPTNANAWHLKGVVLSGLKRNEESLAALEQALTLDPTNALAWSYKGVALARLERYEEALAALEQALKLDPTNFDTWHYKGVALSGLKRHEEALAAFEQALTLDPTNADAWINKGIALGLLERYEEALAAFEQALTLDPTNALAWYYKGAVLAGLKRNEESLAALEQALTLDPTNADAQQFKVDILHVLGKKNRQADGGTR